MQFFKSLQADNTKAYRGAHKAFCETSVREAMAALLDERRYSMSGVTR